MNLNLTLSLMFRDLNLMANTTADIHLALISNNLLSKAHALVIPERMPWMDIPETLLYTDMERRNNCSFS